jgi:hypothetical protein
MSDDQPTARRRVLPAVAVAIAIAVVLVAGGPGRGPPVGDRCSR